MFPETHQNAHEALARIAAKSDWLAAANCLDLAFKRTRNRCKRNAHPTDASVALTVSIQTQ